MYKNILISLAVIALSGCSTMHKYDSPSQNYRLQGDDKPILITGYADQKATVGAVKTHLVTTIHISFNGAEYITGKLDKNQTGEVIGKEYDGKNTSAVCTYKTLGEGVGEIRCMVFIGNERTVTLTF